MKRRLILLMVLTAAGAVFAGPGQVDDAERSGESFWDTLVEVTIQYIKEHGPDAEVGEFVSMARRHAWSRRKEFVDLVAPYLKSDNPDKVAGAIEVLLRFRTYHPMSHWGDFEKENQEFFDGLDTVVYEQLEHLHSLKSDQVYHRLAIYLGCTRTAEAKRQLLMIVESPVAKDSKEQALICLAWHRDPKDMDVLFPYMLEDSTAARSLPYHFRNSYGEASIPYLKKALVESKSATTQLEAAFQLVHLRVPDGFKYLRNTLRRDLDPEGKRSPHVYRITQFARDYLELPADVSAKERVAAYIEKKRGELCKTER